MMLRPFTSVMSVSPPTAQIRSWTAVRLDRPAAKLVTNWSRDMSRTRTDYDVFRAIADPTRRAILDRLRVGRTSVGDLAADFEQSRPAISKHLRVLKDSRLVTEQKVGRERLYALNPAPLATPAAWLEGYRMFWQRNLDALKRYLEDT
jgi:DNA-binding transcriptional ArsR family regulator